MRLRSYSNNDGPHRQWLVYRENGKENYGAEVFWGSRWGCGSPLKKTEEKSLNSDAYCECAGIPMYLRNSQLLLDTTAADVSVAKQNNSRTRMKNNSPTSTASTPNHAGCASAVPQRGADYGRGISQRRSILGPAPQFRQSGVRTDTTKKIEK
jgi:hypothetical protein